MVERTDPLDRTYRALAHPVRREMLELAAVSPQAVGSLAAPFSLSLAAASKHIKVLEGARLLTRAVEGRVHTLSLSPAPLGDAASWLETYRRFWESRLDALEAHLARRA